MPKARQLFQKVQPLTQLPFNKEELRQQYDRLTRKYDWITPTTAQSIFPTCGLHHGSKHHLQRSLIGKEVKTAEKPRWAILPFPNFNVPRQKSCWNFSNARPVCGLLEPNLEMQTTYLTPSWSIRAPKARTW